MVDNIMSLAVISVIPINVSILLHFLFHTKKGEQLSYKSKQIIAGIVFGALAILGTEKGVVVNDAILNARDAAPLCAGLIFGAPAGIISGFIGGVERWLSVYWGVDTYTRLACSVSTCLVGLYSALLKKYIFNNKIPSWKYSLAIGASAEVLHMLNVFFTHLDDVKHAFSIIHKLALPMIIVNALSVTLAVLAINILDKENLYGSRKEEIPSLAVQFQRKMFALVLASFILTLSFTILLQKNIAETDTNELLELNIRDVINDITQASDKNLLKITRLIATRLNESKTVNNDFLNTISTEFDVAEISIVDSSGFVIYSTDTNYVGYNMRSNYYYSDFSGLDDGSYNEVVLPYRMSSEYQNITRKYACKTLEKGGYVQVGYDKEQFMDDIYNEISTIAYNRHIGESGGLCITDLEENIISNSLGQVNQKLNVSPEVFWSDEYEPYVTYRYEYDGSDIYYMYGNSEGYVVYAYLPVDEANLSEDLAIYLNAFMEITVFAALFIFVYFLVKLLFVQHVHEINESLEKITNGDLDTVVDSNSSQEFVELSAGINSTVATLKNYIEEANSRIDAELNYAKEIQKSALPSIFPPFPHFNEFEIYATMDAAKQVGGDFYDFYMLRRNLIAFLVADVSGKSIPGALFMMRAKTLLKTYAEGGVAVADIFTNANYSLCEGNDAGMFVTAWMGVLNTLTGELRFANAGHNPPLVRRKGGDYEYLKSKPGFVLAGLDSIVYQEQSIVLEPGDEIFLYTDGVTEATNNSNELFGEERLLKSINDNKGKACDEICRGVKKDVDAFAGDAPQFDDITMLSVKFNCYHIPPTE
ncbi:MAG: SpoIIE family protein phosphatase [Erysipelotrichaceae bacterium]|nr:SpoIIE family protein phosphatase [Erysipelotrichaceae bacterium]